MKTNQVDRPNPNAPAAQVDMLRFLDLEPIVKNSSGLDEVRAELSGSQGLPVRGGQDTHFACISAWSAWGKRTFGSKPSKLGLGDVLGAGL